MNVILQNVLKGQFSNVLEYVQPHHYFGTLVQAFITLPFHLAMPTSEIAVFLTVTLVNTVAVWFILNMVWKVYNKAAARALFISLIFAPIGIIITSISSDTAGNAALSLMLFLLLDRLISNDNYKRATIISLTAILVDISFAPVAIYILYPHLNKIRMTLFKQRFSLIHFCVFVFIFFESFVVIKLFQKTLSLGGRISQYNFEWAWATFYQHFTGEHSLLLLKIKPINFASFGLFLLMLFLVLLSIFIKKPVAKKSKEIAFFALYFFIYALIFYFLKTDVPYAKRPLSINSAYWQLWFYPTLILIVINLNYVKNIIMNFLGLLILTGYTYVHILSNSGSLNNFQAYNLNFDRPNPRPKIDTIDNCMTALDSFDLNHDQKEAAAFGCHAREQDMPRIKSFIPLNGLFYFGIGLQNFYRNDLGKNYCSLFNDNPSTQECVRGYQHSANLKKM